MAEAIRVARSERSAVSWGACLLSILANVLLSIVILLLVLYIAGVL